MKADGDWKNGWKKKHKNLSKGEKMVLCKSHISSLITRIMKLQRTVRQVTYTAYMVDKYYSFKEGFFSFWAHVSTLFH